MISKEVSDFDSLQVVQSLQNSFLFNAQGEGKRNWIQVLCNAGFAAQLALFYMLDCGSGERAIDFVKQYRSSWLGIGIMSKN